MEFLWSLLTIVGIHVAVVIAPGPNFLIISRNALTYSRQAGLSTTRGVALGILVHILAGFLGFSALVSQSALLFNLFKVFGAVFLIYVGLKTLIAEKGTIAFEELRERNQQKTLTNRRAFRLGLLTCLSNPKAVLYYMALFATVIPASVTLAQGMIITAALLLISLTWYSLVAVALSNARVQSTYTRLHRGIDTVFGGLWIALGIGVATAQQP